MCSQIQGAEGRAGMAAIYDADGTLDINKLSTDIEEQLPTYARPQFIRILMKIDLTGTCLYIIDIFAVRVKVYKLCKF